MKFSLLAVLASAATTAVAAPHVVRAPLPSEPEDVTVHRFAYSGVNGYPIINFYISPSYGTPEAGTCGTTIHCRADRFEVPSRNFQCDEFVYTFDINSANGADLTIYHSHPKDGSVVGGDFHIRMYGPLPTNQEQLGNTTGTLVPVECPWC